MAAGRAACVTVMRAIVQAGMLRAPASAPASASSLAAAAGDAAPAAAADGGGDAAAAGAGAGVGAAEGVDVSLADPDAFVSRYLSDPVYMLKVLKYPPTDGNTDAHTVSLVSEWDMRAWVYAVCKLTQDQLSASEELRLVVT